MSDANELEMILDGIHKDLSFRVDDEANPGKKKKVTERVLIRKVAFPDMDVLGKAWGKIIKELAVYTDLAPERIATLTDDSIETAITEGRRLNFTRFKKWWEWQVQTLDALGESDKVKSLVESVTKQLAEQAALGK